MSGYCGTAEPSLLSEDFQYSDPYQGPLPKNEFLQYVNIAQLKQGSATHIVLLEFITLFVYVVFIIIITEYFEELDVKIRSLQLDERDPGRVWALIQYTGRTKPTSKSPSRSFTTTPEAVSVTLDASGRCYRVTAGYPVDRSQPCDSAGLAGVYGLRQVTDAPLSALATRSFEGTFPSITITLSSSPSPSSS